MKWGSQEGLGFVDEGMEVVLIDRFTSDTTISSLQIYQIPLSSKSPVLSPTEFYK